MALKLYRRHRLECEAGHPEDFRSGEWEERRRGWKRCNCAIHVSGTLARKFARKATGKTTWEDARAHVSALEAAGAWDGTIAPSVPEPEAAPAQPRTTIAEAIQVFLANREATVAHPTYRKYKTFANQLQTFADC